MHPIERDLLSWLEFLRLNISGGNFTACQSPTWSEIKDFDISFAQHKNPNRQAVALIATSKAYAYLRTNTPQEELKKVISVLQQLIRNGYEATLHGHLLIRLAQLELAIGDDYQAIQYMRGALRWLPHRSHDHQVARLLLAKIQIATDPSIAFDAFRRILEYFVGLAGTLAEADHFASIARIWRFHAYISMNSYRSDRALLLLRQAQRSARTEGLTVTRDPQKDLAIIPHYPEPLGYHPPSLPN